MNQKLTNKTSAKVDLHELKPQDWIAGLERGLGVIESFDEDHPRMTAQQVGERCGLTRTSARRYLLTLQHLGYLSGDNKYYWLTPRIMRLGQSYLSSARLPRIVQPVLQRISASLQEVVYLAVLDGGDVVYVARNGPNRAMNSGFVLGARVPSHVTSAGMLMLAYLSDEQMEQWLQVNSLPSYTPYTIVKPAHLKRELKLIREQGWVMSEKQFDLSTRGVAVPLRDLRGDIVGAISVVMPSQLETGAQAIERVVPILRVSAQSLRNLI
ncbi:MAG: IclR family transcriptional regulator C-terminal domain-containing protein [Betaproteobacteria bacterium]